MNYTKVKYDGNTNNTRTFMSVLDLSLYWERMYAISSGKTIEIQTAHESRDQSPKKTRITRNSCGGPHYIYAPIRRSYVWSCVRVLPPADVLFVLQSALISFVLVLSSCDKRPFSFYFLSIRLVFVLRSCGDCVRFVWISFFVKTPDKTMIYIIITWRSCTPCQCQVEAVWVPNDSPQIVEKSAIHPHSSDVRLVSCCVGYELNLATHPFFSNAINLIPSPSALSSSTLHHNLTL